MRHINIEIKAKSSEEQQEQIKRILKQNFAKFIGVDNQTDIYFKVEEGRLKLRKGDIENYLVYYNREDKEDLKQSNVELYPLLKHSYLENIIRKTHDILVIVNKKREIYFIDNVKFHIDDVQELGRFIEIEAISKDGTIQIEKIKEQCEYYKSLFNINDKDLIKDSYSDMLLNKKEIKQNVTMG